MSDYVLLEPVSCPPDDSGFRLVEQADESAIQETVHSLRPGVVAIDFETRGTRAWLPENYVVGAALSDGTTTTYLEFPRHDEVRCKALVRNLGVALASRTDLQLIAHNVPFESHWFDEWLPNWRHCTHALFRLLACEGWLGQTYSLKVAQTDLLGWTERGDLALDKWLVANGHVKGSRAKSDGPEDLLRKWEAGKVSADKAEIWQVPTEILGYYCCLDAWSTWHFFQEVLQPVMEKPIMETFLLYERSFMRLIKALRESLLEGIRIDRDLMHAYREDLWRRLQEAEAVFLSLPPVASYAAELQEAKLQAHREKEPPLLTKAGEPSGRWEQWSEKLAKLEAEPAFNPASGTQLAVLFYERMGFPVEVVTKKGNPSTGKQALPLFGEVGHALKKVKDLTKELEFVEKGLERSEHDGRIHPEFKAPGTFTGRLSGTGGLNLQQVPKSVGYLSAWIPDDGCVWIDQDVASLEQVVLAELSGDEALLKLYGPDAPDNDVYLFTGSRLPVIGPVIQAAGYDPAAPTPEGISAAKKAAKKERGVAKVIVLSSAYGAGVKKKHTTLKLMGIDVSMHQVQKMHNAYWDLHRGVKSYYSYLEDEWNENGGWVLDGLGIPTPVHARRRKDLGNAVVQRTGHALLVLCVAELDRRREAGECPDFQWIIPDFHDELIVQCKEEVAEELQEVMRDVMEVWLNDILEARYTKIKGEPEIIPNFAYAKVEEAEIKEWEEAFFDEEGDGQE